MKLQGLPQIAKPRPAATGILVLLAMLLFALPCHTAGAAQPTVTQIITLNPGWNLISIQVGSGPLPVADFKAALTHPDRLLEVWGYDPSGNPSVTGAWNSYQPKIANFPGDLAALELGRGYWVNVSQTTTLELKNVPPWDGAVSVVKGWNLLGFPGVSLGATEVIDLAAVFGTGFDRIQQVWTFDTATERFTGYDVTTIPVLRELTNVRPGVGYWVYSISDTALVLQAAPFVALPPDSDASPPQSDVMINSIAELTVAAGYLGTQAGKSKCVGRKVRFRASDGVDTAYDLNGNGILDDAEIQDTILFEKTGDTVSITIGNKGLGVLNWALDNSVPWLYTAPADARTWPTGVKSRPRDAGGTVSSEKDILLLYADRSGMTPGRKTGDITLWVGGQAFPIHLLLDVATVDGDWRGFATTTRVGGRNISIGGVRLVLNSFSIGGNEANGFRAVLNREKSILFPRDVYMDGVFFTANQFKLLTTNFEMKAGDRNAPPYDVFPGDPKDRDVNGDGKVDVMNPFPFGLRREVTLLGTRVSPDRLEGTYIESIRGMLPPLSGNTRVTDQNQFLSDAFLTQSQPVFIEGTFVLERQTFTPTKRSVFNESADLQLGIGGSDPTGRTVTFNVTTPVTVQGVTLTLNLTFPDPALLQVHLVSPNGTRYLIHDFGDSSQPPNSLAIPAATFAGENGAGAWILQLDWDGSERGTLASWGLNIEGVATHKASGRIVAAGPPVAPIAGATIRLEGGITTQTFTSSATGTFTIPDLTENDYTLYISKPGYQTTAFTFFVSENDVALGDITISSLGLSQPQLTAAPPIGYAGTEPLHVEFSVDLPLAFAGTTIAWDFDGNGTTDQTGPIATNTQVSHDYATPGIYTAKVTLSGSGLSPPVVKTQIIHVHRGIANPAGDSVQLLVTAFVGAFGARADVASARAGADSTDELEIQTTTVNWLGTPPTPLSLRSGYVPQESKWDSASFDQDRVPQSWTAAPLTPPGVEDSDFGAQTHVAGAAANGPAYISYSAAQSKYVLRAALGTDPAYDKTPGQYQTYAIPSGTTKPNRFRIASAFGGAAFSASESVVNGTKIFTVTPSVTGDIRIQVGRTLP